jgi:hypothetical protein
VQGDKVKRPTAGGTWTSSASAASALSATWR